MRNEPLDPRDPKELPDGLQQAIQEMRARGPSVDSLERLRTNLGVPKPPSPPNGSGGSGASGPSTVPSAVQGARLLGIGVLGAAAIAGAVLWTTQDSRSGANPTVAPPGMRQELPADTGPASSGSPIVAASAASSAPAASVNSPAPRSSRPPTKSEAPKPSEVELIGRAQELIRTEPERSLSLCRQHARIYPKGMLAQEREVLIVEALQRIGREKEAREKSRSFLEENPDTAHKNKVEHVTGDASTP